ncbi:MAG: SDR family NAD(P)-dependent oxidoreductase [Bacteroidota bacterium]
MISLHGKVAVITGGSRGIGAATARLLARAGCDIVINSLQNNGRAAVVAQEIRALGRRVLLHGGSVGLRSAAQELIDCAIGEFGKIDIVVSNAGIWTYGKVGEFEERTWDESLEINLKGTFNVIDAAVPVLRNTGGGSIIAIASTAGQRGEAFHSHYAASKGGVLALTKSLAVELAPHNIRVNAVAPGWVDTEMNEEVFADEQFRRDVVEAIPLKRIATADDIAGSVLFLASDLARHITGATINVNGGSVLA